MTYWAPCVSDPGPQSPPREAIMVSMRQAIERFQRGEVYAPPASAPSATPARGADAKLLEAR